MAPAAPARVFEMQDTPPCLQFICQSQGQHRFSVIYVAVQLRKWQTSIAAYMTFPPKSRSEMGGKKLTSDCWRLDAVYHFTEAHGFSNRTDV